MKAPLISVIVPVFNVELYLSRCLDSILQQTFDAFELICVNDASTDGSLAIILDYSTKDPRIKVLNLLENQGLGGARNEGIKLAQSDYLIFIDSDDWVAPSMFEKVYACAQTNNADIVNFDYFCFFSEENITSNYSIAEAAVGDDTEILRQKVLIQAGTAGCYNMYKKILFISNNCFFPTKKYHEDFIILIIYCYAKKICRIAEPFYYYRNNNYSITRSKNDFRVFEALDVALLMYNSMKTLGFYAIYSAELDYAFYQLFYRRPLLHCFNRFDQIPVNKVVAIKQEFAKNLPWNTFKKNSYYQHRKIDMKERFLLLVEFNHSLGIFLYKFVIRIQKLIPTTGFNHTRYLDKAP